MTVVDVTGGVLGGCCQLSDTRDTSQSLFRRVELTRLTAVGHDGIPMQKVRICKSQRLETLSKVKNAYVLYVLYVRIIYC